MPVDDKIDQIETVRHTALTRSVERTVAAPRVVLTWPLPCSRVNHPIDLSAVASTTGLRAPDHVDFLVDGKIVGTSKMPPFRVPFSPDSFGDRTADVEARAVDRDGTTATFASLVHLNRAQDYCAVGE
jgi:hypothetical protein